MSPGGGGLVCTHTHPKLFHFISLILCLLCSQVSRRFPFLRSGVFAIISQTQVEKDVNPFVKTLGLSKHCLATYSGH